MSFCAIAAADSRAMETTSASVLELPVRTIYSSQTQIGDQLLIGTQKELEEYLNPQQITCGLSPVREDGG